MNGLPFFSASQIIFKDGQILVATDHISFDNDKIFFTNLSTSDTGNYTCTKSLNVLEMDYLISTYHLEVQQTMGEEDKMSGAKGPLLAWSSENNPIGYERDDVSIEQNYVTFES